MCSAHNIILYIPTCQKKKKKLKNILYIISSDRRYNIIICVKYSIT